MGLGEVGRSAVLLGRLYTYGIHELNKNKNRSDREGLARKKKNLQRIPDHTEQENGNSEEIAPNVHVPADYLRDRLIFILSR